MNGECPMGRALLERPGYGPASMRVLLQAFDEAWEEVAGNYGANIAEERRNRLALLILTAADSGERDAARLKDAAIHGLQRSEVVVPFVRRAQSQPPR